MKGHTVRCDLHLHTSKSDGVWPPERLFQEIRLRAIDVFCISDHDCIDAYPVPDDLRPRAIAGLEVDSEQEGRTAHILAYGIDDPHAPLLRALERQREDRYPRMQAMVERLQRQGVRISLEDVQLQAGETWRLQRPHLARALVAKGVVDSVQDAFDRYISDEGEGYVPLKRLSSATIIELIHRSGGVAVVAHPMRLQASKLLEELCDLGADGVEAFNTSASSPADQQRLEAFAQARNLLVTGGSDFHAPGEREIGLDLPEEYISALRAAIDRRRSMLDRKA
ncbi:MAG: hypothetical protein ACXWNK_14075 [Vulcanimicrobiaceae bacterium]